ncbi:MAG TPA: hypothetical protein VHY58_22575 [Streptosporangiaceae bacterium]|nr:hypothetical protein [Streptosporangiaceae bacterium]
MRRAGVAREQMGHRRLLGPGRRSGGAALADAVAGMRRGAEGALADAVAGMRRGPKVRGPMRWAGPQGRGTGDAG